jgi:SAM-dependent methyltransferase
MHRLLNWLQWRWSRYRFMAATSWTYGSFAGPANPRFRDAVRTKPQVSPYSRLAPLYFAYSQDFCPRYDGLLVAIAKRYAFPIRHVLDVACGAGTLTARLARQFESVVGFDINSSMLQCAGRNCAQHCNVRLLQADFHSFQLEERFDAAVCASDSLNYVSQPEDLAVVLRQVAFHLRPGGFFLFDVLDGQMMKYAAQFDLHYRHDDTRFAMCTEYDESTNREVTSVVFADGIEDHVRVGLEAEHVQSAARSTGFAIADKFCDLHGFRSFYILQQCSGDLSVHKASSASS